MIAQDVGAYLACFPALDAAVLTAGEGDDGQAVNGNVCDLLAIMPGKQPLSCKLVVSYKAVLASTKTIAFTIALKHDPASNGSYATLAAVRARHIKSDGTTTVLTLTSGALGATIVATGSATVRGVVELDVSLAKADRYLRATVTGDLSNTSTDTVALGAALVFGGSNVLPA
jgi:hypothetical protein